MGGEGEGFSELLLLAAMMSLEGCGQKPAKGGILSGLGCEASVGSGPSYAPPPAGQLSLFQTSPH